MADLEMAWVAIKCKPFHLRAFMRGLSYDRLI
jgi:hypothetical protein